MSLDTVAGQSASDLHFGTVVDVIVEVDIVEVEDVSSGKVVDDSVVVEVSEVDVVL